MWFRVEGKLVELVESMKGLFWPLSVTSSFPLKLEEEDD